MRDLLDIPTLVVGHTQPTVCVLCRLAVQGDIVDELRLGTERIKIVSRVSYVEILTQSVRQYVNGTVSWLRM